MLILKGTKRLPSSDALERGRQIISQSKHPYLNMDAPCLQRYLCPICFCRCRIPLFLEVRVEEEASLAQLWEYTELQYLQLTLCIKSLVPSIFDCVTEAKVYIPPGPGRKHLSAITKVLFKKENVLPSWIWLDGPDFVLAKMAPP